jgi:predicted DNA-binding transcriptional regulator AlpA
VTSTPFFRDLKCSRKMKNRGSASDNEPLQLAAGPEREKSAQGGLRSDRESDGLLVSARVAAALCGVSLRQWWRWSAMGCVPAPVRIGSTKRWRADELRRWAEAGCPCREEWETKR